MLRLFQLHIYELYIIYIIKIQINNLEHNIRYINYYIRLFNIITKDNEIWCDK